MTESPAGQGDAIETAIEAWTRWCDTLERTGTTVLREMLTADAIDVAEGLRHLERMSALALFSACENMDDAHPYFWTALDPHRKMGGDNPQGLYLSAPINGTDVFVVHGTRGSARWFSAIVQRSPAARLAGAPAFGDALFLPDLHLDADGRFELLVAPEGHGPNWVRTDEYSSTLLVRQFFGAPDDVELMELEIENVTRGAEVPSVLAVDDTVVGLDRATRTFEFLLPLFQGEMREKEGWINAFTTDVGAPTSDAGGVPGGNTVVARWRIEPDDALIVTVVPPQPCAYWDVQVGNVWYESFDYQHVFSGFTCENAHLDDDGSVTFVIADRDPGTANWLEAAGHREGHIALRYQLSEGNLPIPATHVVSVGEVASLTGLPAVSPAERAGDASRPDRFVRDTVPASTSVTAGMDTLHRRAALVTGGGTGIGATIGTRVRECRSGRHGGRPSARAARRRRRGDHRDGWPRDRVSGRRDRLGADGERRIRSGRGVRAHRPRRRQRGCCTADGWSARRRRSVVASDRGPEPDWGLDHRQGHRSATRGARRRRVRHHRIGCRTRELGRPGLVLRGQSRSERADTSARRRIPPSPDRGERDRPGTRLHGGDRGLRWGHRERGRGAGPREHR